MFKIESEVIFPGLVHLHFDTQYTCASTMLRLQEFYESPFVEIRDKYFTLEQYMDRYASENGNFTYTSDWSGFNVPSNAIERWHELFFKDPLIKEQQLWHVIQQALNPDWEAYYIIASSKDGGKHADQHEVMKHEIAHGMWYLNREYNAAQRKIVRQVNQEYVGIGEKLIKLGYDESVLDDEIHAYFATSTMTHLADDILEDCTIPWELVLEAQRNFNTFYEELVNKED